MKIMRCWMYVAILGLCGLLMNCNRSLQEKRFVEGTLEGPLVTDSMPDHVARVIAEGTRYHQYTILDDSAADVSVWVLQEVDNGIPTEGYGITVMRGLASTTFPEIYHGKNPRAHYVEGSDCLWLFTGQMEGTGTMVECARRICLRDNDSAYVESIVEPYNIQCDLCQRLNYQIDGDRITFYDNDRELCTATNTVTDMGGLDEEQPIWIGEQIQFDYTEGNLLVCVTPGVKFTTGLVLTYDDMPTFVAQVSNGKVGPLTVAE